VPGRPTGTDTRTDDRATDDPEGATGETDDEDRAAGNTDEEVVVPLPVYKTVTVTSTVLSVALVVGGFVLLDTATRRGRAAPEDVNLVAALAGLGAIVAAAAVYAYATRFRTAEMGSGNDSGVPTEDDG
jgi:hypothetical protein